MLHNNLILKYWNIKDCIWNRDRLIIKDDDDDIKEPQHRSCVFSLSTYSPVIVVYLPKPDKKFMLIQLTCNVPYWFPMK
jgi:hypothetical protein